MASRRADLEAPRIDELHLSDLVDADPASIVAGDHHEGFRYEGAGLAGRDVTGADFSECELVGVDLHETGLRAARFVETRIERLDTPVLSAARSTWRDVHLVSSRIGAAELYDADLQSMRLSDCKLSYVNLRAATVRDVELSHCTIDELDLAEVRAERVAFHDCSVRELHLDRAQLRHVDLRGLEISGAVSGVDAMRGAVISAEQAVTLSATFTQHLGITVWD